MLRYRIWFSHTGSSFQYHQEYFETMEDALKEAEYMEVFGTIEEWNVEDLEKFKGEFVDIGCTQYLLFNYGDPTILRQLWEFRSGDVMYNSPGFVFNHYREYMDEFITLDEIIELVSHHKGDELPA